MQNKIDQENFYEIHLNKNNEIMISLKSREGIPTNPVLIYDGGEHALFYRTQNQVILLDFIHPEARKYLQEASNILFSETKNYQVIMEYNVLCKNVKNLPIDLENISKMLNRNEAKQIDERNLYK